MAWVIGDWKTIQVFNNNNDITDGMRSLFGYREASMGGAPIINFFEETLDYLGSYEENLEWTKRRVSTCGL